MSFQFCEIDDLADFRGTWVTRLSLLTADSEPCNDPVDILHFFDLRSVSAKTRLRERGHAFPNCPGFYSVCSHGCALDETVLA